MRPRASLFLPFVFLLLTAQPLFVLPSMAQNSTPSITIDALAPSQIDIQAPTTESKTVHFYTTVRVYNSAGIHIDVSLGLAYETGWPTEIDPNYMSFNATGDQAVTITIIVPSGLVKEMEVYINLVATVTYQGYTEKTYAHVSRINILQYYSLDLTWHFMKKDQYVNHIEFDVTNRGSGPDYCHLDVDNSYEASREHIEVNFEPTDSWLLSNQSGQVEMKAVYSGSSFPKEFVVEVRLISMGSHGYYKVNYITVSFIAPDKTQQTYLFAGVISAAVIIMVAIMAALVFGSGKKK